MHVMKKVEMVVDSAAVDRVVEAIEAAGATGYTIVPNVSGKGNRGMRSASDEIFDEAANVLVIVVTREPVANRIVESVVKILKSYSGIVYVVDVTVVRPDHF